MAFWTRSVLILGGLVQIIDVMYPVFSLRSGYEHLDSYFMWLIHK